MSVQAVGPRAAAGTSAERLRAWIRAHLFPEPVRGLDAPGRRGLVLAVAVAVAALSLARQWPVVVDNLYAEDARIFLTEAYGRVVWAAVVKPLSGYVHVVPRLGAEIAEALGPSAAPWVFAVGGAVAAGSAAAAVLVAAGSHLRTWPARAAVAALVGLSPLAGGESINNLAYAQWLLFGAAVWLALWRPATRRSAAAAAAVAVAATLSSPLPLLLAPVVALRLWATRRPEDLVLVVPVAVALAAQAVIAVLDPQPSAGTPLDVAAAGYVQRVVVAGLLGERLAVAWWDATGWAGFATVAVGAAVVALAASLRAGPRARVVAGAAVAFGALVYGVSAWSRGFFWGIAWRAGEPATPLAARYMIVPGMLVVAALLILLEARRAPWRRVAVLGVAGLTAAAVATSFRVPGPRTGVSWSASLATAPDRCAAAPDGRVELAASPEGWHALVPCREIARPDG